MKRSLIEIHPRFLHSRVNAAMGWGIQPSRAIVNCGHSVCARGSQLILEERALCCDRLTLLEMLVAVQ